MRSRLVIALAALLVSALPATPAWAQAERRGPLVSAADAPDDVTIRDHDGPTDTQRRSVDILGLKVVGLDDRVRFTFRIARLTTSSQFDQLLEVVLVDAEPGSPEVSGHIGLRLQDPHSARSEATVETGNGVSGTGCVGYPFVVKGRGLVKLTLNSVCLPPGQVGIRVKSFSTTPKGERRTIYSRDFLRVPGSYDLGGLAGTEPS